MRFGRLAHLFHRASAHRLFPFALGLLAIALMLPNIGGGLFQDDLVHRAHLVKERVVPERYYGTPLLPTDAGTLTGAMRDTFAVTRSREDVSHLKESGLFPWWVSDDLRISNWRPLTALTHWLDYRLFPDSPALMHAHNLLWFGAVVVVVTALYRRMMGAVPVAALAALLYMIDESNYFPVWWVANRNLLLALFFSVLALLCHDRWRRCGRRGCGALAPLLLLLALLSTEAGIATFAYLFAYALMIDRGTRLRRALSLVPAVVVIAGWRIVYNALGHGASGGGFVIDPGREPLAYALAVLERAPLLLMGQWAPLPADTYWMMSERAMGQYLVPVYAFLALVFVGVLGLLKRDRVSRFWLTGMLLCVLPICATVPMNRNLLFAAIGAFGLLARYVTGMFAGDDWVPERRMYRIPLWMICIALLFIHVPVALGGRLWSRRMFAFSGEVIYSTAEIGEAPSPSDKTVVLVNAPNPFLFIAMPHLRSYEDKSVPALARVLVPGWRPLEVTRTGERTLVIRSREGNLLSVDESSKDMRPSFLYLYRTFNTLFRGDDEPFGVGQRVELPDLAVEVLSVDGAGSPTATQFDFSCSLDSPSLYWLQWHWKPVGLGSYSPFAIPAVGETVVIPGPF